MDAQKVVEKTKQITSDIGTKTKQITADIGTKAKQITAGIDFKEILSVVENLLSNILTVWSKIFITRRRIYFAVIFGVLLYVVWIICAMKRVETDKERDDLQFTHEVIWGKNGTDGCVLWLGRTFYKFLIMYVVVMVVKGLLSAMLKKYVPAEAAPVVGRGAGILAKKLVSSQLEL
jgi:hypothetical protein